MLENIKAYLSKQGVKYIKPEKAGPHQEEIEELVEELADGFETLKLYYEKANQN